MDFETHSSTIRSIKKWEQITDIVEELKQLTYSTGNECAVVKLVSGERVIVTGGPGGISWESGEITRILIHSHPYHLPPTGPSNADFTALELLEQASSWLLEHGTLTKFWRK